VAPGEVGGIEVRGPNVFAGYWQMPEKTAQDMTADGYFVTGDLGGRTIRVIWRSSVDRRIWSSPAG
jgi:long-subunit acyl-CoA synthetase (AMP-forming)